MGGIIEKVTPGQMENPARLKMVQARLPVGDGTGRTFASAIRAMMRQNPNTILVGEIRDEETGRAAIRASLTGHLDMFADE
ncbi:MAG: ATPase, T2SS/T4P/T4SS family [Acidithiobacillus ferrivorans]